MDNFTESPIKLTSNSEGITKEMKPSSGAQSTSIALKPQRQKSLKSPILSPKDIAQEIFERSQRNPPKPPEGGDVIFTMKLTQRLAKKVVGEGGVGVRSPDLDARKLLTILQDGAETHYLQEGVGAQGKGSGVISGTKGKLGSKGGRTWEGKLDPELEKRLALKQLMEFSQKRRSGKREEANNNEETPSKSKGRKRKSNENRELERLLQDEGAINMLYDIKKGDKNEGSGGGLLPSKRRMKKALVRKAQEVKDAILGVTESGAGGPSLRGSSLNQRTLGSGSPPSRKPSIESLGSERSGGSGRPEASRIIRRHSSSSSCDSPPPRSPLLVPPSPPRHIHQQNISVAHHNGLRERVQTKASGPVGSKVPAPTSSYETWKMLQEDWTIDEDNQPLNSQASHGKSDWTRNLRSQTFKELRLRWLEEVIHIDVSPVSTQLPHSFNSQVLKELGYLLEEVGREPNCTAVLITFGSHGKVQGIDLPVLLHSDPTQRKISAQQMAESLKEFICKLCMVKKGIVCGVKEDVIGLGVVMLAYMDVVISTPGSTFSTPYPILGHAPEAAATLVLPKTVGLQWARKLLIEGRKLRAEEALESGLVSLLVPMEKFDETLVSSALSISKHSTQSVESSKAMLLHEVRSRLCWVLALESSLLTQHWVSDECQERIRKYLGPP